MKINFDNPANQHLKEEEDNNLDIKGAIHKYLKYWPFIMASVILALFIAFMVNRTIPLQYNIESKFLIKEESNPMNFFDLNGRDAGIYGPKGQTLANEIIMLKSRPIAKVALNKLDFDVEYYSQGIFTRSEIYKKTPVIVELDWKHPQITNGQIKISWDNNQSFQLDFLDKEYQYFIPGEEKNEIIEKPVAKNENLSFGQWLEAPFARFRVSLTGSETSGDIIVIFRDNESLISQYTGDNFQISPTDKTSSILSLNLKTSQPLKARDYLNSLMDVFLENELEEKNRISTNTINFIDSQISGLSDSLFFMGTKLEKFRSSNRTYNMSSEGTSIFQQLSELENSLSQEKFKKEYYQNLQVYLSKENYNEITVPSGLGIEDPILNTLIENLIGLQSAKSRLQVSQTEDSPPLRMINRNIIELNTSVRGVLKNVERNADLLIRDLQDRIAKIDRKFSKLPETEQNLLRLERDFSLNENIYVTLLQKRAESAISKASNTASNKVIEHAVLNFIPLSLKPMLNYLLALMLGIFIPLSMIYIRISNDVKIKESKELEKKLTIPIYAYIGKNEPSSQQEMNKGSDGTTEAFRSLRSNINFTFPREKNLTIMLTSSISGEGKTFCALNLAFVYALSGKKTLLVGCDIRKPNLFGNFKISNTKGVSTYLSGHEGELAHLIQPTQYPNLDVLVEGPTPPNPAELLINDRFEQMISDLKKSYNVVILDTPPIGLASEVMDLMRHVDLTLYLIRYNYSEKAFIDHINVLRKRIGLKNIYAVFNDIEKKELNYRGYGYGYYANDKKKRSAMKKFFSGSRGRAAL